MSKDAPHRDFAKLLEQACDTNPNVPPHNYGRLGWFVNELEKVGLRTTQESVRRWFSGQSFPRRTALRKLAQVLKVDEVLFLTGQTDGAVKKERRLRNAAADGAVNLVAGLVQMHGGQPAFPQKEDRFAEENKIDLYAIIKGGQYPFHVALFNDGKARVPVEALGGFVLGVIPLEPFHFKIVELDEDGLNTSGKRSTGIIEVDADAHPWKEIESFRDRP